MNTKIILTSFAVPCLTLMFAACEQSINAPEADLSTQDIATMKLIIATDPLYTSDGVILDNQNTMSFDLQSLGKTNTPIYPRAWYRRVSKAERDVQFDKVNDTTVIATITHTLTGEVKILAKYSPQDTTTTTITKPFTHVTLRKVKFARVLSSRDTTAHWKPVEVSATKGGTQSSEITITQLEVVVGDTSYMIMNPTEYFFSLEHPRMRPLIPSTRTKTRISLRLYLSSADPDTDFVAVHYPFFHMGPMFPRSAHSRLKLVSQTQSGALYQRVYEHTWEAAVVGRHHFFVDALTKSSLYDDKAPFSAELWGIPYITQ